MEETTHNGYKVRFNETTELWYAVIENNEVVENVSLKKLKESLDLLKKKKFERIPVLVQSGRYRLGGGRDDRYAPQFGEAVITSVAPNGSMYLVRHGEKHAEKFSSAYSTVYMDTPANRAVVAEIEEQGEIEWRAEVAQRKAREKLKAVNGRELFEKIYGRKLNG